MQLIKTVSNFIMMLKSIYCFITLYTSKLGEIFIYSEHTLPILNYSNGKERSRKSTGTSKKRMTRQK